MTFKNCGENKRISTPIAVNRRGLAILFKDSLPAKDIKIENIIKGNYTQLTFTNKAQKIVVKCICAPNKDMTKNDTDNYSNKFFKTVFDDTDKEDYDVRIKVGDFNVAPVHEKDTAGCLHVNNQNSRNFLERMLPLSNLTEVYRNKYPELQQYTLNKRQTNNYTRTRKDYFLMNLKTLMTSKWLTN